MSKKEYELYSKKALYTWLKAWMEWGEQLHDTVKEQEWIIEILNEDLAKKNKQISALKKKLKRFKRAGGK